MKRIYVFVLSLIYILGIYSQKTSLSVGTIPGNFDVSSSGAATYTIPIECPAGFSGLQPNIALVYSSQGGDNIAGWGWGLSGLSYIGKSVKNIFSDNYVTGFNVLKGDKYTLDGKTLVLSSGTYGGDGAVYKFENDDFTRITSIGQNASPQYPLSFKVETRDGKVIEYSRRAFPTKNDMNAVTPAPYQWLPEKITDVNGNFIKYTYYTEFGYFSQVLISKIEYAGNVDDNKCYASIEFTYSSKVKDRKHYMNAYFVADNALLSNITVRSKTGTSEQIQKIYKLIYKTENEECFLTEVQLENGYNQKINSTFFTWGNNNEDLKIIDTGTFNMGLSNLFVTASDVTGDGRSDLVVLRPSDMQNGRLSLEVFNTKLNKDEFSGFERVNRLELDADFVNGSLKTIKGVFLFVNTDEGGQTKRIVVPRYTDFQNNRYMNFDVYLSGTTCKSLRQDCSHSDKDMPIYECGDINNDGCDEIVSIQRVDGKNYIDEGMIFYMDKIYSNTQYSSYIDMPQDINFPSKLFIQDFDGDGLKDLCVVAESGTYILKNMGGASVDGIIRPSFSLVKTLDMNSDYSTVEIGDFNGDGLPDFIVNEHCNSTWKIVRNYGSFMFAGDVQSNITAVEEDFTSGNDDKDECIVMDFDHDGKSDLVIVESVYHKRHSWGTYDRTEMIFYRSNGNGFDIVKSSTAYDEEYVYRQHHTVGDFDGDGREELLTLGSDIYNGNKKAPNAFFYTSFNTNFEHKQIKSITDGFGNQTEIAYQPLTCNQTDDGKTFYSRESARYYPLVNVSAPLYCVKSVKMPMGETLSYTYKDAISHLTGKGFLGFGEVSTKNSQTLHVGTLSTYLDWSYYLPAQQITLVTDGNNNKISENFVSFTNLKVGNTYQSRLLKVRETDFLKNLVKTTDYLSYDAYNNLLEEKTTFADNISVTTNYTYKSPLFSPYLIGQLSGRRVVHNYRGDVWTDKETIMYNSKHLPASKITYTGLAGNKKTGETRWTYNNRGSLLTEESARYSSTRFLGKTYTYDLQERIINIKDEFNHNTIYSQYNKWGDAEKVTDFMGNSTTYRFDGWGRKSSTSYPDGVVETTSIVWGLGPGLYVKIQNGTSKPNSQTFYDSFAREIRNTEQRFDNALTFTDRQYDANGNLKKLSLPYKMGYSAFWTDYEYDIYNRPTRVTDSSGKITSWTYSDNTVSETKDGITTTKVYDVLGRLEKVIDPAGTILYAYNAGGQLLSVTAPGNVITSFEYDNFGRQIAINDPSAGTKIYAYDKEGNVNSEIDANGEEIITTYNDHNQIVREEYVGELTTDYIYSGEILVKKTSNNGTKKEYEYDGLLRVSQEKNYVDGKCFIKNYTFQDGHISEIGYKYDINGVDTILGCEQYIYSFGTLTEISWNNDKTIWKLNGENSLGLARSCVTGNLEHIYSYDIVGNLTAQTVKYGSKTIQSFSYNLDTRTGNLLGRTDKTRNLTENFGYDELNRLTSFGKRKATYNEKGNITDLTGVGGFEYRTSGKPYAASAFTSTVISEFPIMHNAVTYNSMMRPKKISQSISSASFTYNGDGERVLMTVLYGTRMLPSGVNYYYVGDRYESIQYFGASDDEKEIFYIGGDAYSAPAVLVKDFASDWQLYYICRDYLGSITHIVDESGNVKQELSYDAWGSLRDPETQKLYAFDNGKSFPTLFLGRGYTGHEHLTRFGLINMNARLYDPLLGRFLSPDPYVQAPENSQNFNRYSYCLNNPLSYTDRTGEFFGVDDIFLALGMAYFGGIQANFAFASENGGNPFDPGNWNWKGVNTYASIVGGAIGGMGMAGYNISSGQIPGMVSNGLLQAGVQVGLNGIDNVIGDRNFFDNWYLSAGMGLLNGVVAGNLMSYESDLNYWWGNEVAYNRTQWSFINTDKPDQFINFNIPNVGSSAINDCVPTTFAEIETKRGGTHSYDDFKKRTRYIDGVGVMTTKRQYAQIIKGAFLNVETLSETNNYAELFDFSFMRSVADKNGVVSVHFDKHADNIRKVAIFNRAPWKNKIYFRQSQYNFNSRTIDMDRILNIFKIY